MIEFKRIIDIDDQQEELYLGLEDQANKFLVLACSIGLITFGLPILLCPLIGTRQEKPGSDYKADPSCNFEGMGCRLYFHGTTINIIHL